MGQNHSCEDTIVDGFHCFFLLAATIVLNAIVDIKYLHDLPLLFLTLRARQQFLKFFQLLVVNSNQVQLLVQSLNDGRLLL